MTEAEATLIAASVAAAATLLSLVFTLLNNRGEEFRTAQRDVIANDLKAVGRAVHEVIALSNLQLKALKTDQHPDRYRAAAEAAKKLKELRLGPRLITTKRRWRRD